MRPSRHPALQPPARSGRLEPSIEITTSPPSSPMTLGRLQNLVPYPHIMDQPFDSLRRGQSRTLAKASAVHPGESSSVSTAMTEQYKHTFRPTMGYAGVDPYVLRRRDPRSVDLSSSNASACGLSSAQKTRSRQPDPARLWRRTVRAIPCGR